MTTPDLQAVVDRIAELPENWHGAGSLGVDVLRVLADRASTLDIQRSVETGAGKSTLLLSHVSDEHWVFALDQANSVSMTRDSSILRSEAVRIVEGPTQLTLRDTELPVDFQFALLDGPHAYPFPELEYYALYPRLTSGGLLIIDDIHIPTIRRLFEFVAEDAMFELLEIVHSTAFLSRTDAPTFDPLSDGWEDQAYNRRRFPVRDPLGTRLRKRARKLMRRLRPR